VLRDHQGNPYALVVDGENMARSKELVIDRAMGDKWLVSSGLAPGDRMIVDGVQRVRPGMEVKATEAGADQPQTGEQ
jgi:membrane fusion protein (multidrug efflux system)